jgi:hypothetical protein
VLHLVAGARQIILQLVTNETTRHSSSSVGGRTRTDKIGVGAGVDIVVATSTTQVWCTHIPTKSVSAPAAISVVLIFHVIFMARQYTGPTGQIYQDECAPALCTNQAYLSRGSPASRRHVGSRPDNFVLSAPCTAWPQRLHEISVPPISPPGPTPILSVRVCPP